MRSVLTFFVLLAVAVVCRADVVTLNDDSRIEGKLQKYGDNWIITKADGSRITVKSEDVRGIEVSRGTSQNAAANAKADLQSLRSVVDSLGDLKQIIQRYQKFIDNPVNATVRDDAAKDLSTWQDRLDRGLVKFGGQWVTPQERAQIRTESDQKTLQARDLLAHGQSHAAEPLLADAVQADPTNVSALYLDGLRLGQQDHIADARKRFEAIVVLLPDNAPALNNLAVLAWKQKLYTPTAGLYNRAMLAAPLAKDILNNVAELLAAMPENEKNSPTAKRTADLFATQDAQLQQMMAQAGWYRWGATWVTGKQMDDLKAAEEKIQGKLDALKAEFDKTRERITMNEAEIQANQATMDRLSANTTVIQPNGTIYQMPLPPDYAQLQTRNGQLAGLDQALYQHLDDLRGQGKTVRAQLPVPQYTGVQNLIGVEGMPPVALPDTRPAND